MVFVLLTLYVTMTSYLQDLAWRLQRGDFASAKSICVLFLFFAVLITAITIYFTDHPYRGISFGGEKPRTIWQAKQRWLSSAKEIIKEGLRKVSTIRSQLLKIHIMTDCQKDRAGTFSSRC